MEKDKNNSDNVDCFRKANVHKRDCVINPHIVENNTLFIIASPFERLNPLYFMNAVYTTCDKQQRGLA